MQLRQQTLPFPYGGQHGGLSGVPSVTALETFRKPLFWAHWQGPAALLFSPGRWCRHQWPPCFLVPGVQPGDRVSPAFTSAWSPESCLPLVLTPRDPRYQFRKGPKNCEEMKAPPPIPQASTVTQLFPLKSPCLSLLPGGSGAMLGGCWGPTAECLLKRRPLSSQAGVGSRQGEGAGRRGAAEWTGELCAQYAQTRPLGSVPLQLIGK